jgi:hypothetical protein
MLKASSTIERSATRAGPCPEKTPVRCACNDLKQTSLNRLSPSSSPGFPYWARRTSNLRHLASASGVYSRDQHATGGRAISPYPHAFPSISPNHQTSKPSHLNAIMAPAAVPEPAFRKDEKVYCFHHELLYEAKVLEGRPVEGDEKKNGFEYRVHYKGWKNTYVSLPLVLSRLPTCRWTPH